MEEGKVEEKNYQVEGVKWMCEKEENGSVVSGREIKGGILADEMGLGKTIQMIATILSKPKKHTLIVLPRALLEQWNQAMVKFVNHYPLVYHNSNPDYKKINSQLIDNSPIILTTYGMINRYPILSYSWDRIVFDEAHHLRSPKSKNFKYALQLSSPIKWLITGTPIQNKRTDFYSLCRILNIPESFYIDTKNAPTIAKLFILKRTKLQVGLSLPPLNQHIISAPWKSNTEKLLAQELHQSLSFSNLHKTSAFHSNIPSQLAFLTYARQSCILPSLLSNRIQQFQDDDIIDDPQLFIDGMNGTSKLDSVLHSIIQRKDNGNRKLIFCHYRGEIDYIKDYLIKYNLTVQSFDGRVPQSKRQDILTDSCDVLILQIKTGCEGLNLQQFNEVYFVSPHWNPAVEDQAVARCHRFGQDKPVEVFRFNMDNLDDNGAVNIDQYSHSIQLAKRVIIDELDNSPQ